MAAIIRILVDADACPVKTIVERVAAVYGLDLILVVNPHHEIESNRGQVLRVDGGSQAVDLALANLARSGDIVVTQDYGLACMVLAKHSQAIHPNGWLYEEDRIDGLLMQRHISAKARRAGYRTANPRKRASQDNQRFEQNLTRIIEMAGPRE